MADTGMIGAAQVANSPKSRRSKDAADILATARTRFTQAVSAYGDSREDELDDLRFLAASPDNQWQWPADVLATRGSVQGQTINARPCLTINKLPPGAHPKGRRVVSPETSRAMLDIMRMNVIKGSGGKADAPKAKKPLDTTVRIHTPDPDLSQRTAEAVFETREPAHCPSFPSFASVEICF